MTLSQARYIQFMLDNLDSPWADNRYEHLVSAVSRTLLRLHRESRRQHSGRPDLGDWRRHTRLSRELRNLKELEVKLRDFQMIAVKTGGPPTHVQIQALELRFQFVYVQCRRLRTAFGRLISLFSWTSVDEEGVELPTVFNHMIPRARDSQKRIVLRRAEWAKKRSRALSSLQNNGERHRPSVHTHVRQHMVHVTKGRKMFIRMWS